MKGSNALKDTFKQMNLGGGSIIKAYNNLKQKRRAIGQSVKDFDKIEMMDNPNAFKVNHKDYTEEGYLSKKNKKSNEPFYKTHIVNMTNFEELLQSNDKLSEDNKILVQIFDKMKERTFTPKSQVISHAPTHRAKYLSGNYNQTFSSSELWKTPRHKLLSTAATFGMNRIQEPDSGVMSTRSKKKIYFEKDLNPFLLKVVKYASLQQAKNETNQKEMQAYVRKYSTVTDGFGVNVNDKDNDKNKRHAKLSIRKYKDNSKFSFPLINQIIYKKKKKADAFEKAKENMIKYCEEEYHDLQK